MKLKGLLRGRAGPRRAAPAAQEFPLLRPPPGSVCSYFFIRVLSYSLISFFSLFSSVVAICCCQKQ